MPELSRTWERLNAQQQAFVLAYVSQPGPERIASRAAKSAGYSPQYGAALLRKQYILDAVMERISISSAVASRATGVTTEKVLNELSSIGFSRINEMFHWSEEHVGFVPSMELTDEQAAAIQSIKARTMTIFPNGQDSEAVRKETILEIRLHPKIPALQMIANYLGMLVDRAEHNHRLTVEHKVQQMSDDELVERATQLMHALPEVKARLLPPGDNGSSPSKNGR
jgi:hypothetical protein